MNKQQLEAAWKKLAYKDYEFFLTYAVSGYKHAKHTKYICDMLRKVETGEIRRLMVSLPPRHSKSETITKFFPAYWMGKNPDDEVMVVSYSADLASDFTQLARNTLQNVGEEIFGAKIAADTKAKDNWGVEGHRGKVFATSPGGVAVGKGFRLGIIDDPIKGMKEARSAVEKRNLLEWYKGTFRNRATPDARIIIVATRWAEDDLIGQLLAEDEQNEWTVLNLPAICEEDNDPLDRNIGDSLWPERFPYDEYLSLKRDSGTKVWNSLYQGKPAPDDGEIFKREWFNKTWNALPQFEQQIISMDATFKGTDNSDYVVMQCWGKRGAEYWLIDQVRAKMDFTTTLTTFKNFCIKHPAATRKLIEDKANGTAIINTLQKSVGGIIPINPRESKEARAQAVSPLFEAGNIYLPNASWIQDYVEEFVMFPSGKHDDQIDATSQALNYINTFTAKPKVKVHI